MLGKILLTITVMLLGLLWLRRIREQERRAAATAKPAGKAVKKAAAPALNDYRFAAYLFLALMIGSASCLYYVRWQDDHSLVTVILHRDGAQSPVTYQVQKNQLAERAF